MPTGRAPRQLGFTYMGLLMFVALAGIALSVIGPVWHMEAQREREKQLLFVGDQIAQAIASYYTSTPAGVRQYPPTLQALLQDKRFPVVKRHLRREFRDPMTDRAEWGLVMQQDRIIGVYSRAKGKPVKQDGFDMRLANFKGAGTYQDWRFMATPEGRVGSAAAPTASGASLEMEAGTAGNVAPLPGGQSPQLVSAAPSPSPAPASETAKPQDTYGTCAAAWNAENASCRASCGPPAGAACRTCMTNSFAHYRACLHGG